MVHVRRWIDHAKRAIQIGRREVEWDVDPPRELYLERISGNDVFANPFDVGEKLGFLIARYAFGRGDVAVQFKRLQHRRSAQARDRVLDGLQSDVVRGLEL